MFAVKFGAIWCIFGGDIGEMLLWQNGRSDFVEIDNVASLTYVEYVCKRAFGSDSIW